MRGFAPFVAAIALGAVWVGFSSTLIPAAEEERGGSLAGITDAGALSTACTGATVIARMPEVGEASGLAVSRRDENLLWTHNASGSRCSTASAAMDSCARACG